MPDVRTRRVQDEAKDLFGGRALARRPLAWLEGHVVPTAHYGQLSERHTAENGEFAKSASDDVLFRLMNTFGNPKHRKSKPNKKPMASEARRRFNELALTFDGRDWEAVAAFAEARACEREGQRRKTQSPAKYKDRPDGEHLVEFLRREYRDGGYLGGHFSLADLRRFDPECAKAVVLFEHRNGPLPLDISLPKRAYRRRPE